MNYKQDDLLKLVCIDNPESKKGLTVGKEYYGCGCNIFTDEVWVHVNDKGNDRRYFKSWFTVEFISKTSSEELISFLKEKKLIRLN
jgi:hypothetical protein